MFPAIRQTALPLSPYSAIHKPSLCRLFLFPKQPLPVRGFCVYLAGKMQRLQDFNTEPGITFRGKPIPQPPPQISCACDPAGENVCLHRHFPAARQGAHTAKYRAGAEKSREPWLRHGFPCTFYHPSALFSIKLQKIKQYL